MDEAFGPYRFGQITGAIASEWRKAREYTRVDVTSDDFLSLYVRPSDRATLVYAAEVAGFSNTPNFMSKWKLADGTRMGFHALNIKGTPFVVPKYITDGVIQPDVDEHVFQKVSTFFERQADNDRVFGMMWNAFYDLNKVCTNPQQVRFYFPGIVHLLKATGDEACSKQAEKLKEVKVPRGLPAIPLELREFCKQATRKLSLLKLLSENEFATDRTTMGTATAEPVALPWNPKHKHRQMG